MEKFNYCIARYWKVGEASLSVYDYFGEVHYGNMDQATQLLNYVTKDRVDPDKGYFICKVEPLGPTS